MNRRAVLALCATSLAGCLSDEGSDKGSDAGGKNYTAPADVDVYDEPRSIPEPPDEPTRESALAYVRTYEERRIYNELLGEDESEPHEGHVGVAEDRDVVDLEIDPIEIDLLRETDRGYYIITSIGGRAEYWCSHDSSANDSRRCSASSGRNANAVVHYVDADGHVRIPYNWYRCAGPDEPYESPATAENAGRPDRDSPAQLQVYDVTGQDHEIDLTVRYVDGTVPETFFAETVTTPPYLAVVADLTRRVGTYEVEVALATGPSRTFTWELTDVAAPSWTGTSIFVAPPGDLWIDVIDPDADVEIPSRSCGRRFTDRSADGDRD